MQLIDPAYREGLSSADRDTQDLMSRAGRPERRITKLETDVAGAQFRNSDNGTQALEREIARIHARIDSVRTRTGTAC